jgi:hypothetical protein
MNYIKTLEQKNKELQDKLDSSRMEINDFIKFLTTSPKFQSTPEELKNWISTPDVIARLEEIRNQMYVEE